VIGWEDLRDIFRVEGFPLQRPDWRVNYCNCLLYVFPTRNIVNFLINFTFLTVAYLSKARYSLFVLKVALYSKSINQFYCLARHIFNTLQMFVVLTLSLIDWRLLQRVVQAVIMAVKNIYNIMLVTCLLLFIFSVIGVQLFKVFAYLEEIRVSIYVKQTEGNEQRNSSSNKLFCWFIISFPFPSAFLLLFNTGRI